MTPFARSLPMMLYRTLAAVMPEFRAIFAKVGLTEPQWRVLRVLWEHDGATVAQLAGVTLIPAPSLVGVLDRMQQADLVERRPSQSDRRQVHVFLRPGGRNLEKRVRPMVEAVYARLHETLSPAEWRALYGALDRLDAVAHEPEARKASGAGRKRTPSRQTAATPARKTKMASVKQTAPKPRRGTS